MTFLWIAGIVLAVIAALWLLERFQRRRDERKFPCPGRKVQVNGRNMHIVESGEGPTLVLLPGLATYADSIDFLPLTRRLEDFHCVVPEPFGYGWSDGTSEPRTVKNIVDELRAGLRAAGIQPPYLLLGHSVAGLYTRWWACEYPEEVAGIVGVDPSLPEQALEAEMMAHLPDHGLPLACLKAAGALNHLGLGRLCTRLSAAEATYMTGGDMALLPTVRARAAAQWNNRAYIGEYVHFGANAAAAGERFPTCPVLMFAANGLASCGGMTFKSGFSWVDAHRETAQRAVEGEFMVLPGGHYLHWMFPDVIADRIRAKFSAAD